MSTSPSKRRKLDSPPAPPEGQLDFGGPPSLVSLPFPPSSSSQVKNVVAPDTVTFSLEGAASNGPAVGESMSKQQQMTVEEAATAARVEEGGGDEPYVFDEEEHEEKLKIWDLFAEEYHDVVSELPLEYHRNFRLLEELEEAQQSSTETMKSTLLSYLRSHSHSTAPLSPLIVEAGDRASTTASASKRLAQEEQDAEEVGQFRISTDTRNLLKELVKATRVAVRSGEDKVGVCLGMYESVDRHILRLDASLAQQTQDFLKNPISSLPKRPRSSNGKPPKKDEHLNRVDAKAAAQRSEKVERIDPNEPTYCFCQRVSFGQMIGCENENCLREWFHLECVQLTSPPLGKWYCSECSISIARETPERGIFASASSSPVKN